MTSLMFGANFAWVSYNSILLLPLVQRVLPADRSSLAVGVVAFAGNMLGIVTSLLAGTLSDHSTSRLGKRTPSLLLGSLVGLPVIALAAVSRLSFPVIIASYVGMHLLTNVANGAWWPLLVDLVPEDQRGLASGLQGFQMVLASAFSFVFITYLNEINRPDLALVRMAVVFTMTGLACAATIRRDDRPASVSGALPLGEAVARAFLVQTRVPVVF